MSSREAGRFWESGVVVSPLFLSANISLVIYLVMGAERLRIAPVGRQFNPSDA